MKIELNKQLDKEVYLDFYKLVFGGSDFGEKIHDNHPSITKENYIKYIDDYYELNKDETEIALGDIKSCFVEIKDPLFLELQNYFNRDYSLENYTCYLSIFDCNPRYLETKSFQVYYKRSHEMKREVVAHELTHFAFYDFCNSLGLKNDNYLWELSEIFNVLFLNSPVMVKIIGNKELLSYPNLKDKLKEVRKIWEKKHKPETFVRLALEKIK